MNNYPDGLSEGLIEPRSPLYDKDNEPEEEFYYFTRDFDARNLVNIEVEGVDTADHPDYCDAFVSYAEYNGQIMSAEQLEWLDENHPDIAQGLAFESLL